MSKIIVYVDMDNVLCDFNKSYDECIFRCPEIKYPQSQYGFFLNLEPINGGKECVRMMLNSDDIDVYILTAPSEMNPFSYTEKRLWVEKHLGMKMVNRLIISPNKALLKGDVLIDDNNSGKGQDEFEGTLFHFGASSCEDWDTVTRKLALIRHERLTINNN